MKSRANIKSHPIHPILVTFPIAFLFGTAVLDTIAIIRGSDFFWLMGFYMEMGGIAFGLLAAIPGIIDYKYTLPEKSSAKKRGATHGLLNTTAIILFSIALYLKYDGDYSPLVILSIEIVGVAILSVSGWMGGTLVYRNQAGVDVRYAGAGKWKEIAIIQSSGEVDVAPEDELSLNQMMLIRTPEKRIVLGRTEKGYVAFNDFCSHKGGPLSGGSMMCGTVQCPWHGSQFDVETGECKAGPGKEGIKTYSASIRAGRVYVRLS